MESENLGEAVRAFRQARGWTQQQLAEQACMATGTVHQVERGHTRARRHTIARLAKALRVKVEQLKRFTPGDVEKRTEGEGAAA